MAKQCPSPVALTAAFALMVGGAGCHMPDEAREEVGSLLRAHSGSFDVATRTPVPGAADGRTFVLRATARRQAHWYEAMAAMSRDLGDYCADGVPFSLNRMSPAHDPRVNRPGEYTWHDAGTVFEQEITCSDPFAGQRVVAVETDAMKALQALRSELAADGRYDRDRHLATVTSFNDKRPKYQAVTETVGSMVMGVNRRCRNAGAVVQRILVHSNPTPETPEGFSGRNQQAFVGVDAVCADGQAADPRL